jgi:hypothetical protein
VPDVVGRGKAMYRQRKQVSIDRCREFLKEEPNRHWMKTFVESKKKDDLADTVLQALSFINTNSDNLPGINEHSITVTKKPVKEKPIKIVARKPNENQIATKYSKSNLAWFIKNKTESELLRDKRFMKDLGKYFKNISELRDQM